MSAFKPQQRHLTIRGRDYHFVSYEGHPADARKQLTSAPSMWFLMVEGRRFPVFPCEPSQPLLEVDAALSVWVEDNALGPVAAPRAAAPRPGGIDPRVRWSNWWGTN